MIPDFNRLGQLPAGVHRCSAAEFLSKFAQGNKRSTFVKAINNVINYAASSYAESILIGGSFITDKEDPTDLDCVILFSTSERIPAVRDGLNFDTKKIDIFFASKDQESIIKSFTKLFSTSIYGEAVGVIEIILRDDSGSHWDVNWEPDEDTFEIVKRVYLNRNYVNNINRDKVLVTVHGIRSHADWNGDVTLIAGANGWIVAPFHYGYIQPTIFANASERRSIVEKFREFLSYVNILTDTKSVSVLAHSFGTYVVGKYITGFDTLPTTFDTVILTGAILNETLDFSKFSGKVGHVINEIAPNDEWAEWAKIANLAQDELFGNAGTRGFDYRGERLTQHRSNIFSHTNVIKRDIMVSRWMPALEANFGSSYADAMKIMIDGFKNKSK